MRQIFYYWYNLVLFGITYMRNKEVNKPGRFWIITTYHHGSVNTVRMKNWDHIKQYLKANKNTVKRHFMSNVPLPEKYCHSKFDVIILGL